jgi:hypothetical protein
MPLRKSSLETGIIQVLNRREMVLGAIAGSSSVALGQTPKVKFWVFNDGVDGEVTVWLIEGDTKTEVFKENMKQYPMEPYELPLEVDAPDPKNFDWQHKNKDSKIKAGTPSSYSAGQTITVYSA